MFGFKKKEESTAAVAPLDLAAFLATIQNAAEAAGEGRTAIATVEEVPAAEAAAATEQIVAEVVTEEVTQPEPFDVKAAIAAAVAEKVEPLQMEILELRKQLDEKQTLIGLLTMEKNELIEMIDSETKPAPGQPDVSNPEAHTFSAE